MSSPSSPPVPVPTAASGPLTPPSAPSGSRGRSRVAALVLAGSLAVLAGWSHPVAAQDPGVSTTVDLSTAPSTDGSAPTDLSGSSDLTGSTEAPGTPALETDDETTVVDTAEPARTAPDTSEIDEENRKFVLVVAGLVAVAVALALLTIRYWRVTRPVPADPDVDDAWDEEDGDWDDEDEGWDEGAEAEAEVAVAELDDDEVFVSSGRRSRRAVAGADHADVDAGWEPMATGEQERVSGQIRRATIRPSRTDRARAFQAARGTDPTAP